MTCVRVRWAAGLLGGASPDLLTSSPPQPTADRATETEEALQRRLGNATREVEYGLAAGNFDEVVVNGDLEAAYGDLVGFLERCYYAAAQQQQQPDAQTRAQSPPPPQQQQARGAAE